MSLRMQVDREEYYFLKESYSILMELTKWIAQNGDPFLSRLFSKDASIAFSIIHQKIVQLKLDVYTDPKYDKRFVEDCKYV